MSMRWWWLAGGLTLATVASAQETWRAQGVVHVDRSPQARLHSVPVRAVTFGAGFWEARRRVNVERSLPAMLELLEAHGVVDNFRRLSGRKQASRKGPLYTDSDVYKWIEAAAFVLQSEDRPPLRAAIDRLTDEILAAQEPSGYLNTYYVDERKPLRFQEQTRGHELYCLGHLLQAAIAFYRATGNRRLLDGGIRMVDYLIREGGPGKQPLLTGHPELEMALVELYRTTGRREHLELAGYLLSGVERERLKLTPQQIVYMFSGKPFVDRTQFEGHAVRAMYASCGAADFFMETGQTPYRQTLERLWADLTERKMYITGGVGSRAQGEAFGEPYELPNSSAYTESCAAIGNLMLNWRMLLATGEAKYAGVIERALYNGINSGLSLDGTLYCYRNPLASRGEPIRNPWYDTTCCPPNLQRILASLPGYQYTTDKSGLWVHLYHNSTLDWHLEDGSPVVLRQETEYPWKGEVAFTFVKAPGKGFPIHLRIPEWAAGGEIVVGPFPAMKDSVAGHYTALSRLWRDGDRFTLRLPMKPLVVSSNPRVADNWGRVAVQRGPLVYALEEPDQPAGISVFDELIAPGAPFREETRPDLLGGVVVLKHAGKAFVPSPYGQPLYAPATAPRGVKPAELTFIPYYAWANRGNVPMNVWVPVL